MGIWKYGDQIGWGPFVQGDQILGDHLSMGTEFGGDRLSRGINFMGIVCPGGQEVGDRKSGDQMGWGPNALQPPFHDFPFKLQHSKSEIQISNGF